MLSTHHMRSRQGLDVTGVTVACWASGPSVSYVKHAGPSPRVPGSVSVIIKDGLSVSKPLLMEAIQEISPLPAPTPSLGLFEVQSPKRGP